MPRKKWLSDNEYIWEDDDRLPPAAHAIYYGPSDTWAIRYGNFTFVTGQKVHGKFLAMPMNFTDF